MRSKLTSALSLALAISYPALTLAAGETGMTGGGQAFINLQPSLALNYFVPVSGIFPGREGSGGAGEQTMGNIRLFAGTFAPGNSMSADGQVLAIRDNTALFSLLGTTFGGDGRSTFALPDLRSRTAVHAGSGPWQIGETRGAGSVALTPAQLPSHSHSEPFGGGTTGSAGANQAFTNTQPSLGLNYVIATDGIFAGPNNSTGGRTFLGQMGLFAGNFAPSGWAFADGQTLAIENYDALFQIIGTTYGGDGQTTFALPDLRGRTAVGSGQGPGLYIWSLGQAGGTDDVTLTPAQMPAHLHSLPAPADMTGTTGGDEPFDNAQPSLALTYLIATEGVFPPRETNGLTGETLIGEVSLFAANYAPRGWAVADGQLLGIASNTALFSVLGTTYGGDGRTTFALPDLLGRTVIGAHEGGLDLGIRTGIDELILTVAELPPHLHTSSVPLPAGIWLLGSVCGGLFGLRRMRSPGKAQS